MKEKQYLGMKYRIKEVHQNKYTVYRLGDETGEKMEFSKEEFHKNDIRRD